MPKVNASGTTLQADLRLARILPIMADNVGQCFCNWAPCPAGSTCAFLAD